MLEVRFSDQVRENLQLRITPGGHFASSTSYDLSNSEASRFFLVKSPIRKRSFQETSLEEIIQIDQKNDMLSLIFQRSEDSANTSSIADTTPSVVEYEINWMDYLAKTKKIQNGKYETLLEQANVLRNILFQKLNRSIINPQISENEEGGINICWYFNEVQLSFDLLLNGTTEWFCRNHSTGVYDGDEGLIGFDFINSNRINNFFSMITNE